MKIATAIVLGVALAATGTVAFAARNSSGTYALPSGNPVVGGTQISSTWANNTLGDLAQGVTDSLDRNGRGSMLAPLRVPNGTVTAPTVSFTNETTTGLYRIGAGNPAMSVLGSKRQEWTSTGTVVTGTLGATGDIALSAVGDQTIGKTGANLFVNVPTGQVFGIQLNGVTKWQMDGTGKFGGDGTNVITGVASPSGTSDVATKGYVDGLAVGTPLTSASSGSFSTASGTAVDVTNLSVTITTRGRPVMLFVQPDGSGQAAIQVPAGQSAHLFVVRGSTTVADWLFTGSGSTPFGVNFMDAPAAGTYTYKIQTMVSGGATLFVNKAVLAAYEL